MIRLAVFVMLGLLAIVALIGVSISIGTVWLVRWRRQVNRIAQADYYALAGADWRRSPEKTSKR